MGDGGREAIVQDGTSSCPAKVKKIEKFEKSKKQLDIFPKCGIIIGQ